MILMIGAALGLISVGFGAYSEHALRPVVTEESFRFLMTAVRYNQVHAVVIVAIGLSLLNTGALSQLKTFKWSAIAFILGTVLFSFSIYLSVYLNIPSITYLTPVGGITLMIAWFLLLFSGYRATKN
jgi:uncharacterized membrane protein YgdD (TMEM256/DUF423 family)